MAAEQIKRWFKRPCRGPIRRSARQVDRRVTGLNCVHRRRSKSDSDDDELEIDDQQKLNTGLMSSSSLCCEFNVKGDATSLEILAASDEGNIPVNQPAFKSTTLLSLHTPPSSLQSLPLPPPPRLSPPPRTPPSQQQQKPQLPALSSQHNMSQQLRPPTHPIKLPSRSLTTRLQTIFEESIISNGGRSFSSPVATAEGGNEENDERSDDLDELDSRIIFASDSPPSTSASSTTFSGGTPPVARQFSPAQRSKEPMPGLLPVDDRQVLSTKLAQISDNNVANQHSKATTPTRAIGKDSGPAHTETTTTTCSSASASEVSSLARLSSKRLCSSRCGSHTAISHISPVVRIKEVSVQPLAKRLGRKSGFGGSAADTSPNHSHRKDHKRQRHPPLPASVFPHSSSKSASEIYGVVFPLQTSDLQTSHSSASSSSKLLTGYTDNNSSNVYAPKTSLISSVGSGWIGGKQSTVNSVSAVAAAHFKQTSRFTRVLVESEDESSPSNRLKSKVYSTGSNSGTPGPSQRPITSSPPESTKAQPQTQTNKSLMPPPTWPLSPRSSTFVPSTASSARLSSLPVDKKAKVKYNNSSNSSQQEATLPVSAPLTETKIPDRLLNLDSGTTTEEDDSSGQEKSDEKDVKEARQMMSQVSKLVEESKEATRQAQELLEGHKQFLDEEPPESKGIGGIAGAGQKFVSEFTEPPVSGAFKRFAALGESQATGFNNLGELCRGQGCCHNLFSLPSFDHPQTKTASCSCNCPDNSCQCSRCCCQNCNGRGDLVNSLADVCACHSSSHSCQGIPQRSTHCDCCCRLGCRSSNPGCLHQATQHSSCCKNCRCSTSCCGVENCPTSGSHFLCCCQLESPPPARPAYEPPNRYINPHSSAQYDLATVRIAEPLHWFADEPGRPQQDLLLVGQRLHQEQIQTLNEQWTSAARTIGEVQRLCKEAASERAADRQETPPRRPEAPEVSKPPSSPDVKPSLTQTGQNYVNPSSPPSASPPGNTANVIPWKENEAVAASTASTGASTAAVSSALPRSPSAQYMGVSTNCSSGTSNSGTSSRLKSVSDCSSGVAPVTLSRRSGTTESLTIETSQEPQSQCRYHGADSNSSCSITVSSSVKSSLAGTSSLGERSLTKWTPAQSIYLEPESLQ